MQTCHYSGKVAAGHSGPLYACPGLKGKTYCAKHHELVCPARKKVHRKGGEW